MRLFELRNGVVYHTGLGVPIESVLGPLRQRAPAGTGWLAGRPADAGGGRVRVGLWCPVLVLGGAERWQVTLARAVDPSRVVWQGCAVLDGPTASAPAMVAATAALMPVGYGPTAARELAARCDVLVQWAIDDVPARLAGIARPPAVVCVCHSPPESLWTRDLYTGLKGVDAFVAVSTLALATVPADRRSDAVVIENAVDPRRVVPVRPRAAVRAAWGVPAAAPVAGYLGRLSSEKDPGAMRRLAAALPDPWRVVVVGDGTERAALGRHPRLTAVGPDPDAGSVLGAFDVLVVPSFYESFGLTIVEGLLAGVPVVATPVGVAALVPGLTRSVPVGADGATLAAAVAADAADPAGTAARVAAAREVARARWGPERFGREWTEFLVGLAPARVPVTRPTGPLAAALAAVRACPERGPVLPVSAQREGCRCGELSRCRAGRGRTPGAVTLAECLACVAAKSLAIIRSEVKIRERR